MFKFQILMILVVLKWVKTIKSKVSWSKFPSIWWNYNFSAKFLPYLEKNFIEKEVVFLHRITYSIHRAMEL
jgi:hypothetical protein